MMYCRDNTAGSALRTSLALPCAYTLCKALTVPTRATVDQARTP